MNMQIDELEDLLAGLAEEAPSHLSRASVDQRVAHRGRRRRTMQLGGGLLCVAALIGGVFAARRPAESTTVPAGPDVTSPVDGSSRPAGFVGAEAPPYLAMPDGWTLDYIYDGTFFHPSVVVVPTDTGFAGGSFVIADPRNAAQYAGVPGAKDLAPFGLTGVMNDEYAKVWRTLVLTIDGVQVAVESRRLSEADTIAIAKSLAIVDGTPTVLTLPDGFVALTADELSNVNRSVEYQYTHADGVRHIQATLYSGGNLDVRLGGDPSGLTTVQIGGHDAFLNADDPRLDWVDGFWVWEVDGQGYTDQQQFLTDAATVIATDRATWEASLGAGIVSPSERPAQVQALIADIPMPPDFDISDYANRDIADVPMQLAIRTVEQVWCTWAHRWDTALRQGDTATANDAAAVIAASANWQATRAPGAENYFSILADESAKVAAGDRTVMNSIDDGVCGTG